MGNLVDTFVLAPKSAWIEALDCPDNENLNLILRAVPQKYRMMLRALLVRYGTLDAIMENRDHVHAIRVFEAAEPFETDEIKFTDRSRGECLQQVIRKTFYDTLMIVEEDCNPDKYNFFICLRSNQVISERIYEHGPVPHPAFAPARQANLSPAHITILSSRV
jgi:hypothetical protein